MGNRRNDYLDTTSTRLLPMNWVYL